MKLNFFLFFLFVKTITFVLAQSPNQKNTLIDKSKQVTEEDLAAPNSYIYDIDLAKSNNYGGIYIPVKKAYDVWEDKSGFLNKEIPIGKQTISIVWQTKLDLINLMEIDGEGRGAKMKIGINPSKGKGSAIVALHVGKNGNNTDPIYWSWHIWVTDDPTSDAITYVNNADSRMVNTFMNRNLGAVSSDFFGVDWNKAAGLMYQWGRKDPFPRFRYADETLLIYYDNNNQDINNYNYQDKIIKDRPSDFITDNIKYSINNPLYFINSSEYAGAWFASNKNNKKVVNSEGYAIENYDLWGDNNKGLTNEVSFEQQAKAVYDPCPTGWRVPSFAHANSTRPEFSPWGSGYNYIKNEDPNVIIKENNNKRYPNAKFYPRMGVEFEKGSDNYNIGIYALTGGFKKYNGKILYQDNLSETAIWSATLQGNVQGRNLHIINDPDQKNIPYLINTAQEASATSGFPIRCVKDIVTKQKYETEFFYSILNNYDEGLNNPNSYILYENREVFIPVSKAYSVYNQITTEQEWIPEGKQTANVNWTTNKNLIKSLEIIGSKENARIHVKLNDNQYGNAVVSLNIGSNGDSNDNIYWSWHIWAPKSNPEEETIVYTSDVSIKSNFKVYNTKLGYPPMKTEFMNRVLGAIDTYKPSKGDDISTETYGMLYQWGRKDPLPGFYTVSWGAQYEIYLGENLKGQIQYSPIKNNDEYINLGFQKNDLQNKFSKNEMLSYSIQHPIEYLFNTTSRAGDWISNTKLNDNRWSHATKKSIFDPCPDGWRVPDFGFKFPIGSPWAKASLVSINDKLEVISSTKFSDYKIGKIYVRDGYKIPKAFTFYDSFYKFGYLPVTGNRRYIKNRGANLYDNLYVSSVWSSTVTNEYTGFVFGMDSFDNYHNVSNGVSPSEARNVVCSKDIQRFSRDYFKDLKNEEVDDELKISDVDKHNKTINFYPNPVKDILHIDGKKNENYFYQIYDFTGNVVSQGKFIENKINIGQLKAGVYLIRINNSKEVIKIIKK